MKTGSRGGKKNLGHIFNSDFHSLSQNNRCKKLITFFWRHCWLFILICERWPLCGCGFGDANIPVVAKIESIGVSGCTLSGRYTQVCIENGGKWKNCRRGTLAQLIVPRKSIRFNLLIKSFGVSDILDFSHFSCTNGNLLFLSAASTVTYFVDHSLRH